MEFRKSRTMRRTRIAAAAFSWKPFWGREGANIVAPGGLATPGPYEGQPLVWQEYAELPRFAGRYPVLGSWVVAGRPSEAPYERAAVPTGTR